MKIYECPQCRRKLKVAIDRVGKKGKCPACGKALNFNPGRKAPNAAQSAIAQPSATYVTEQSSQKTIWTTPAFLIGMIPLGLIFTCCGGCLFLRLLAPAPKPHVTTEHTEIVSVAPNPPPQRQTSKPPPRTSKPPPSKPIVAPPSREWFSGGNLHTKSAIAWQTASYDNKLATCADFVCAMWKKDNLKPVFANTIQSMDSLRPYADELVDFMDESTKIDPDPDKNKRMFANQSVHELAAIGMVMMGWTK